MTLKLLDHLEPVFDYSFVITTRNNFGELTTTIETIVAEAPKGSEVVVVDGSDIPYGNDPVAKLLPPCISLTCVLDEKTGVFDAMNVGVRASRGRWIIMITAGDKICRGGRVMLESIRDSPLDAVIFAQEVADPTGNIIYSFQPTPRSVWPHQSVILKRTVHEQIGLYPREFRYASDQHLFALIRKRARFEIRREVFSVFLLGGITSSFSIRKSRELFALRRALRDGVATALVRGYVFPFVRSKLEKHAGFGGVTTRIRKLVFPYYR